MKYELNFIPANKLNNKKSLNIICLVERQTVSKPLVLLHW